MTSLTFRLNGAAQKKYGHKAVLGFVLRQEEIQAGLCFTNVVCFTQMLTVHTSYIFTLDPGGSLKWRECEGYESVQKF